MRTRSMRHMSEKAFQRIHELARELGERLKALDAGKLDRPGLEAATEEARELYERLVVLRHKAREGERPKAPVPARPEAPKVETPKPDPVQEEPPVIEAAEAPIRLDTRPPDPKQVSLMDVIAESEAPKEKAPAKPAAKADGPPTLKEKLEQTPLPDLAKGISLSDKFWFVAELFGGDRVAFEQGVEALNGRKDLADAQGYLKAEVLGKLKKAPDEEALAAFQELLQRRYK